MIVEDLEPAMADAFHKSLWRPGKTRDGRACQSVGETLADIAASLAALAELKAEDSAALLATVDRERERRLGRSPRQGGR